MNTLIVVGGCFEKDFLEAFLNKKEYDYIIGVDMGVQYLEQLGIVPNEVVGDFDSYADIDVAKYESRGIKIKLFNPEKDDTDTEIAINEVIELKSDCDIVCACGGRIDHMIATIYNLIRMDRAGLKARIIDSRNIIFVKSQNFVLDKQELPKKYISFIPISGAVEGLTIKGLKYTLDKYILNPGSSRCISNEFEETTASVSFEKGCLLVINSSDVKSE